MEGHNTLNMLMNSLFANNNLRNWSIFEEKNGAIVVRLRFDSSDTNSENDTAGKSHVSYKKKSESQLRRDRNRAARHNNAFVRDETRSESVQDSTSPELPRHAEQIIISDTTPLDFSPVQLSPSATSLRPVNHGSAQQIQGHSTKQNSSFGSMLTLDTTSTSEELSCAIEMHSDSDFAYLDTSAAAYLPPIPHEIPKADYYEETNDGYTCLDEACSYGPRDLVGVCFVNISICHKCKNVYLCDECLSKGRHHRHRHFIAPSIPFLS